MQNVEILVTLGPSSLNEKVLTALSQFWGSLFRINLFHTPFSKIETTIQELKNTDIHIFLI